MTNTFLTGTDNFYALAESVTKFKNDIKVQMIFNNALLLDYQGKTVCPTNVVGVIEGVVEIIPIDGVYFDNIRYIFSLAGGNIVKVLVS